MNTAEPQPTVSVVIPAWNAEATLGLLLDTVRGQTWKALEIIVVDDGSKDRTAAIAEEAAKEDSRIRVIRQECRGVSAARNAGLAQCTWKYIRFADADDTVPPDSMEKMVARAEADGSELVIGGYTQYIGEIRNIRNLANRDDVAACDDMMKHLCSHANSYFYGVLWNKLFLREIIEREQVRFVNAFTWGEDFAFVMDYLRYVNHVSFMKDLVYDYRRSAGSTSVKQGFDSVKHPIPNLKTKIALYGHLKDLYKARGQYKKYSNRLWMYLYRVGWW